MRRPVRQREFSQTSRDALRRIELSSWNISCFVVVFVIVPLDLPLQFDKNEELAIYFHVNIVVLYIMNMIKAFHRLRTF